MLKYVMISWNITEAFSHFVKNLDFFIIFLYFLFDKVTVKFLTEYIFDYL